MCADTTTESLRNLYINIDFYRNWIDNNSPVNKDVTVATVGGCTVNRLLCADGLVLLTSSQQRSQHELDRFSAAYDQAGMKISTGCTGGELGGTAFPHLFHILL